jgi:hypothetical protein
MKIWVSYEKLRKDTKVAIFTENELEKLEKILFK